tara:strand:+ start:96145 stop:96846 length:702 start_codon:yes stop_codon:yes gene_type:complete
MPSSNENATANTDLALEDEQVREYLKDNADFLQRHPDLLDHLHISHASGSAISLVEKQVSLLRERNIDMRHRLNTLTANARENDKLYERTRTLVLKLLEADSREALCDFFMSSIAEDFGVEHASIILFGDSPANDSCRTVTLESANIEIGALLKSRKAVCGALRKEELAYLFPNAGEVGSAALMPLRASEDLGLIAVGSSDGNRYSSNMGTLFLSHIADVIVRLLPRLPHNDQ